MAARQMAFCLEGWRGRHGGWWRCDRYAESISKLPRMGMHRNRNLGRIVRVGRTTRRVRSRSCQRSSYTERTLKDASVFLVVADLVYRSDQRYYWLGISASRIAMGLAAISHRRTHYPHGNPGVLAVQSVRQLDG
jgi:hypothetical protein